MKLRFILATFFLIISTHTRADDADDCVKSSGDTKIASCTRAIESGRWQGSNLSWAYNNRGVAKRAKGDLDGTIADFNRALELDPQYANAYKSRGNAKKDKGDLDGAIADLARSQELKPDAYSAPWLFLARTRSGTDGKNELITNTTKLDNTKWPAPVVALYLGKGTPATVLSGAENPDPKTHKDQLCEANFYIGQWQLTQGDRAKATASLRTARDQCPKTFVEYTGAVYELKRLGVQ